MILLLLRKKIKVYENKIMEKTLVVHHLLPLFQIISWFDFLGISVLLYT